MISLCMTFAAMITAVLISVFSLLAISIDQTIAVTISSSIFAAFPYVHDKVEDRQKKKRVKIPQPPSIYEYCHSKWKLLLIATSTVFGLFQFNSAVASIISSQSDDMQFGATVATLFILIPAMIPIGRLVGSRSFKHGVIIMILSIAIARAVTTLIDFLLIWTNTFDAEIYTQLVGLDPDWAGFLFQTLGAPVVLAPTALFGFWRGRRRRLANYLMFLMKRVSPEVRNTIVELAYEEAAKSAKARAARLLYNEEQDPKSDSKQV